MIEVLIVDDQKTVREILSSYLEEESGLKIVGCATNGKEAIDLIKVYQPHVVLMDIEMPIMDGLTATRIISEQFINTSVLIISVHNEDNYLNTALQVGAKGYLKKNTPARELINAIYSAYKGYFQLGPGLLERYLHKVTESQSNTQEIEQLKSVILEQSKLLDSFNQKTNSGYEDRNKDRKSRSGSNERVDLLETQLYRLSVRFEQLNNKLNFIQQFLVFVILCSAVAIMLSLLAIY